MDSKRYSIGTLILKLQALGYEVDAPTLKRLEEKGVIDSPARVALGEHRADRQYTDEDLYAIIRDLEWYYGLRSSVDDALKLKRAWHIHEGVIKKLQSDSLDDIRAAEIYIEKNRDELTRLVLEELQTWEVAKRGDKRHLELRKQALKQMNDLIRSLRDKRSGFGLLKQKLWEGARARVEKAIHERIASSPGIRQCELYEGYEEFTSWIAPMLAEWAKQGQIRRVKDGRTYRVYPSNWELKVSA
ncbi:MAG: hypothetical protein Kow0099_09290 [Candidatus Abyssubacteria bacterium]